MTTELSSLHVLIAGDTTPQLVSALENIPGMSVEEVGSGQVEVGWSELAEEINRRIDDHPGWILLLKRNEMMPPELVDAISRIVSSPPAAWAYRIPVIDDYCGSPLYRRPRDTGGEIRLFHSRRCRFQRRGDEHVLMAKGTVIRLGASLRRTLFASGNAHREHLARSGTRRDVASRVVRFISRCLRDAPRLTVSAIRFHWNEAGWD